MITVLVITRTVSGRVLLPPVGQEERSSANCRESLSVCKLFIQNHFANDNPVGHRRVKYLKIRRFGIHTRNLQQNQPKSKVNKNDYLPLPIKL